MEEKSFDKLFMNLLILFYFSRFSVCFSIDWINVIGKI
jgi:hypothetical protein